jgi:hypothetical protein
MTRGLLLLIGILGAFLLFGLAVDTSSPAGGLKVVGAGVALLVLLVSLGSAALIEASGRTRTAVRNLDETMTKVLASVNRLRTVAAENADREEVRTAEAAADNVLGASGEPEPTAVKKRE